METCHQLRTCSNQLLLRRWAHAMNMSALNLLNDLGSKISSVSGDDREGHFLFQRLSVILQRYNAVLLYESFVQSDSLDL